MFPTQFQFIWLSRFRKDEFQKSTNQKQALPMAAMFVYGSKRNKKNTYRESSIDASYQVSVHLAKWFQSRRFLEIDQSETRSACGGHVCVWIGTKLAIFTEDLPQTVQMAKEFQRRRLKCEKLTDDRRQTTDDGRQVLAKAPNILPTKLRFIWLSSFRGEDF